MQLYELQLQVEVLLDNHNLHAPPEHRVLDLASEVGELAKEVLRSTHYGQRSFEPTDAWRDEMGDVLFALICAANASGVDLESVLVQAISKVEMRLQVGGSGGSAG